MERMAASFVLTFILCALYAGGVADARPRDKVIICYFTNWSQYRTGSGKFLPSHVKSSLCTHLFYAFHKIDIQGNTLAPIEWNYNSLLHPGILAIKEADPGLRVVLSVGGYNADIRGWLNATDPSKIQAFVSNVVTYLRANQFDGLCLDWEYPEFFTRQAYISLVQNLRSAFNREARQEGVEPLILAADVAANKDRVPFYSPHELAKHLDLISVMAYDFYGDWSLTLGHNSPLFLSKEEPHGSFLSQNKGIEMWLEAGIPASKLVLGMAAYGRSMKLFNLSLHTPGDPWTRQYPNPAPYTKSKGFYAYYEACQLKTQPTFTEVFMTESRVPYVYGILNSQNIWVGYDNVQSFKEKTAYALSRALAGVMMWTLDFDDFIGTFCNQGYKYPLLTAVNEIFMLAPRCLDDNDCKLSEIEGVCVDTYCACPAGSFLSTKKFCEGTSNQSTRESEEVETTEKEDIFISDSASRPITSHFLSWMLLRACMIVAASI